MYEQAIVGLLSRHRREIAVPDLETAAFVIINCVEHLTYQAQAEPRAIRAADLEAQLNRLVARYLLAD